MATNEWDIEYGSTPESANREHTDIEPSIAWKFAIWLAVSMAISAGIVYGTFWLFEGREQTANRAAQVFPMAAGQVKEPPGPHLQTQPFKDIYMLRQNEQDKLTRYEWIDKNSGAARIPIDEAMRLVIERGLVQARPQEDAASAGQVVGDSSAGRVLVAR
jgi:hypothetical protein